jgi:hypothetical protein
MNDCVTILSFRRSFYFRTLFEDSVAGWFWFDPHNRIVVSPDAGYGTAAWSIDGGAFAANTGDDAIGAFALIGPADPITAFHFFLPPFLPIGFWGFLGPVYFGTMMMQVHSG